MSEISRSIAQQKARIMRLSARAELEANAQRALRANTQLWKQKTLGSPKGLAWSFAAGAWLGSRRERPRREDESRRSGAGRKAFKLANTGLLIYRLMTKEIVTEAL